MVLEKGKYIGVWISEEGARLFLGQGNLTGGHRWLVVGHLEEEHPGVGIWIEVDEIIELEPPSVLWADPTYCGKVAVTPKLCLIRWQWVISVQASPDRPKKYGIDVQG